MSDVIAVSSVQPVIRSAANVAVRPREVSLSATLSVGVNSFGADSGSADAEFFFDPPAEPYGPWFPDFARTWFSRFGRAYAGGVAHALATMARAERVERRRLRVVCDYAARDPILRVAEELEARVEAEEYGADVTLVLGVPVAAVARFRDAAAAVTAGQAIIEEA